MVKRKYRCPGCKHEFEAEDPPDTIPASFVFCPKCGGFPEKAEEVKLKPSCYGGFGSEECIMVGCGFQDSCEIEETESFKKAQEAEGQ